MWSSYVASCFAINLVMFLSVRLCHIAKFPLFVAINRVDLPGINSTLVSNSNISCILIPDKTALICWPFPSFQLYSWSFYHSLGASSSLILHNLVWCSLYPSITCLPPFVKFILVLYNIIVHMISSSTVNYTRFWVREGNLYPLRSSLFKLDTFVSASKFDTIWYPSGFTSCNSAAVR